MQVETFFAYLSLSLILNLSYEIRSLCEIFIGKTDHCQIFGSSGFLQVMEKINFHGCM